MPGGYVLILTPLKNASPVLEVFLGTVEPQLPARTGPYRLPRERLAG